MRDSEQVSTQWLLQSRGRKEEVAILGHCEYFLVRVLPEISLLRVSQRKMPETDKKTDTKQTDR